MRNYIKNKQLTESYIMDIDDEDDDASSVENHMSDYGGGYPSIAADEYNARMCLTT